MAQEKQKEIDNLASLMRTALEKEGIYSDNVLAYVLATAKVESAGKFAPVHEYGGDEYYQRYEGRADLGNTSPGDGVKYHGRGVIQLTGKANYQKYGDRIGEDLVNNPDKVMEPDISAKIMAAYFKDAGVAQAVEAGDINRARKLVNGGFNGLKEVNDAYKEFSNNLPKQKGAIQQLLKPQQNTLLQKLTPGLSAIQQQIQQPTQSQQQQVQQPVEIDPRLQFSQGYGSRPSVYQGTGLSGHEGFDYIVNENTPVHSPMNGTIERVGDATNPILAKSYGNYVFIRGDNGEGILLGHNNSVNVEPGQRVNKGDQIALSGATGFSEAPHIHASYTNDVDRAIDSLNTFEQTGVHKYADGGFTDPSEIMNNEYANSLINPRNIMVASNPLDIAEATSSAKLSSPSKSSIGDNVKQTASNLMNILKQPKNLVSQAQAYEAPEQKTVMQTMTQPTPGVTPAPTKEIERLTPTYASVISKIFNLDKQQSQQINQSTESTQSTQNQSNRINMSMLKAGSKPKFKTPGVSGSSRGGGRNFIGPQRTQGPGVGSKSYTVRKGDTPGGIAQRMLGDASRWREIYKGDPRKMQVGSTIRT